MRCPRCSTENRPDARFCRNCGSPLAGQTLAAAAAPAVAAPAPPEAGGTAAAPSPEATAPVLPVTEDTAAPPPALPAAPAAPAAFAGEEAWPVLPLTDDTLPPAGDEAAAGETGAEAPVVADTADAPAHGAAAAADSGEAALPVTEDTVGEPPAASARELEPEPGAGQEYGVASASGEAPAEPGPAADTESGAPGEAPAEPASMPDTTPAPGDLAQEWTNPLPTAAAHGAASAPDEAGPGMASETAGRPFTAEASAADGTRPAPQDEATAGRPFAAESAAADGTRPAPQDEATAGQPGAAESAAADGAGLAPHDGEAGAAPVVAPTDMPPAGDEATTPLPVPAPGVPESAGEPALEHEVTAPAMVTALPETPATAGPAAAGDVPPFGLEEAAVAPVGTATAEDLSSDRATGHLPESEAAVPAPPVPGEPFPALAPGTVVVGRYQVQQVVQTGPQRQTYLATDLQGYRRCWACGSRNNIQGEQYCTDCGAQLTGRIYRLLETPADAPLNELPAPLLENRISGVATVFDTFTDDSSGRHYLALEEMGGQPVDTWAAPPAGAAPPDDERALALLVQAAEKLRELHGAGIVGCDFTSQALQVLPDDRLVLADPTACRIAGQAGDGRTPQTEAQADTQRVAAALEQWYQARQPAAPAAPADAGTPAGVLARGREGAYHTAAEFAAALKDLLALTVSPPDLQLVSGRASNVGEQRQLNEDSLLVIEYVSMEAAGSAPLGIYIVADGMGGHESGEVASSIAIRTIAGHLHGVIDAQISGESQLPDAEASSRLLREAIIDANTRITRLSRERHSDMGTTVTMALVIGNQATVANVGDSRTYLWRDGKLQQISQDHSLVARLIAAGQITAEEGRNFDRRNEIYRALGDPHLTTDEVDIFHVSLRPLDALVLCSDGLWEMIRDEDIEGILLDAPDPSAAAQTLIDLANHNGGADNISVIIAQTMTNMDEG